MTLIIGQSAVKHVDAVSELTRQAIAFIDGGTEWLRWAVHGTKVRATFPDESQMAGAIQMGLHGTPFAYLSTLKLLVSPIKLMTFSLDDLRVTAEVERGPSKPSQLERVKRIFDIHRLLTADQLAAGMTWLSGFKLADMALFQVMTFQEQAAIADLAAYVKEREIDAALSQAAADFAITESRAPLEFVDFYRTYLGVSEKLALKAPDPGTVLATAQLAVHELSPLAFHALDCPQTQPLASPDVVDLAIELWVASGQSIGFSRVSACVREIVLHTRLIGADDRPADTSAWARDRFNAYLETSLALARRAKLSHPRMGQDGATCQYTLAAGDYIASLQLDPTGVITLNGLTEITPIETVISPFTPPHSSSRKKHHDQAEDTAS